MTLLAQEAAERTYRISSVEKAFAVLDAFTAPPYRFTLSEISARSRLSTNQAFRLLHTLLAIGFVRQEPETKVYSLGPHVFGLVPALFNGDQLLLAAREPLEAVFSQFGQIVSLIVPDGEFGTVCVYVRDDSDATLMPASIGSRSPFLHAGAVGKLFLACKTDDAIERYLAVHEPLHRYTEWTPVTRESIWREVRAIRSQGVSISEGEVAENMYGIAAPIRDRRGDLVAALTLAAPVSAAARDGHQAALTDSARRISANLGYRAVVALG